MRSARILLLEDEPQLAKIVAETLTSRGFLVTQAANGRIGLEVLQLSDHDLCIVDVMMPFMDGFSFVKELRRTDQHVPVLFLTARSQDKDVIEGYQSGGNDYLKKPFSLEELILRVKELLKRSNFEGGKPEAIAIGDFVFYAQRQELVYPGQDAVKLSHRESELLFMLAKQMNHLLDRKVVLTKLWGEDNPFNARTMDVFVTKLRKHLRADTRIEIINVRGQGYKLIF